MTKLTTMCATQRRQIARAHRVEANILKIEMDIEVGFTAKFAALKMKHTYRTAQAKLWEAAANHAEMQGFVRLA